MQLVWEGAQQYGSRGQFSWENGATSHIRQVTFPLMAEKRLRVTGIWWVSTLVCKFPLPLSCSTPLPSQSLGNLHSGEIFTHFFHWELESSSPSKTAGIEPMPVSAAGTDLGGYPCMGQDMCEPQGQVQGAGYCHLCFLEWEKTTGMLHPENHHCLGYMECPCDNLRHFSSLCVWSSGTQFGAQYGQWRADVWGIMVP